MALTTPCNAVISGQWASNFGLKSLSTYYRSFRETSLFSQSLALVGGRHNYDSTVRPRYDHSTAIRPASPTLYSSQTRLFFGLGLDPRGLGLWLGLGSWGLKTRIACILTTCCNWPVLTTSTDALHLCQFCYLLRTVVSEASVTSAMQISDGSYSSVTVVVLHLLAEKHSTWPCPGCVRWLLALAVPATSAPVDSGVVGCLCDHTDHEWPTRCRLIWCS